MLELYVSKTGDHAYRTLQEAVLAVPDDRNEWARINIAPGVYKEKVFIRKEKLEIIGSDSEHTVFCFDDGAKKPRPDGDGEYGTFNTSVIFVAGKDIIFRNITIENTAGPGCIAGQALALYVAADCCIFEDCRLIGFQDTIFAGDSISCQMKRLMLPDFFQNSFVMIDYPVIHNYFRHCYIAGDVDFIFGPNVVYFDQCEIFSRKRESENCSFITAASTPAGQEYGFVFSQCRLTSNDIPGSVFLGRPWRDYAKTAFINCFLGSHIHKAGWQSWGKVKAEAVCCYLEYGNYGPGADSSERAPFSKQLNNSDLEKYFSIENVFPPASDIRAKTSGWTHQS